MQLITRAVSPTWPTLFFLIAFLSFAGVRPVVALEEVIVSYAARPSLSSRRRWRVSVGFCASRTST